MTQKWSDLSSATATDRLIAGKHSARHLSDGTLVFLDFDGTSVYLKYSSDHSTINTIATLAANSAPAAGEFYLANSSITQALDLVVDNLDNLYVISAPSSSGTGFRAKAFTKGAGYTWTAQTMVVGAGASIASGAATHAVWCNTGGGTSSKGHILAVCGSSGVSAVAYAILDAGVLLAGTGTLNTATGTSPTFMDNGGSGMAALGANCDLSADGFGATSGICVWARSSTTLSIGAWAVNSSGALSTNTSITGASPITCGTLAAGTTHVRAVRYASNAWAIVAPSTTAGRYMIARYSASAQLTALTDSGAPASMPLNSAALSWDAIADPVTANKVWVYATAAVSASQQQMYRLGAALASGVTWDGAVTTDDLLTTVNANGGDVRTVKEPRKTILDWQVFVQTAAAPTYALYGDYTQFDTAPNASTLTAPANASAQDLAAGFTFLWTFSDPDAGDTQAGYYFRRKISGAGSYEYWNAGTGAWQGTEVFNAGAPGSLTFAASKWTNGNIYNWSVKTRDNFGALDGPYASDFTVTASTAPVVTVTGPSGTAGSSTPTVTWTYSDTEGSAQATYQVKVESGTYGSTPGSGTAVWDSTELSGSSPRALQIGVALANTVTYRVFMRVSQAGSQYSVWAFATFTVNLDPPAQPTVTAVADNVNGRVALTVQGRDNLLTTDQASFETAAAGWAAGGDTIGPNGFPNLLNAATSSLEDGTVGTWVANTNVAVANSAAVAALDGTKELRMTSVAAGGMLATNTAVAISPSTQYTVLASFRTAVTARSCRVWINWLDAGSVFISNAVGTAVTDGTGGWTQAYVSAVAPANAAFAYIALEVLATGAASEVHYVDCISIAQGFDLRWVIGGSTPATIALDGIRSMVMAATGANSISANTPTGASGFAVTPSKQYTALASFRTAVTARACSVQILWYKAGGAASSVRASDTSGAVTDAVGSWTQASITAVAPSDAVTAAIVVQTNVAVALNEVHYVDCVDIGPGASTLWTRGGLTGLATALLEYTDNGGGVWSTVRGAAAVPFDSGANQQAIAYDYESPPNTSRSYRATVQANV